MRLAAQLHPELALVDVRMPGMDGVETARRLMGAAPDLVVVLISVEEAHDLPAAASGCGAAALLRKQDFRPVVLGRLWASCAS